MQVRAVSSIYDTHLGVGQEQVEQRVDVLLEAHLRIAVELKRRQHRALRAALGNVLIRAKCTEHD